MATVVVALVACGSSQSPNTASTTSTTSALPPPPTWDQLRAQYIQYSSKGCGCKAPAYKYDMLTLDIDALDIWHALVEAK
jgi:hypothetical protein